MFFLENFQNTEHSKQRSGHCTNVFLFELILTFNRKWSIPRVYVVFLWFINYIFDFFPTPVQKFSGSDTGPQGA